MVAYSVYLHLFVFEVAVHVIIIDQRKVTGIYNRAILATVTLECHVKKVIWKKTWTGTLANSAELD